jgi:hypothetical protein
VANDRIVAGMNAFRRQLAIRLLLSIVVGCRPENQNMLVAYVEGDVFLPSLRAGRWDFGEDVECEIASRTSTRPDDRGDLLLCGAKTQLAWSQAWLRADIKTQIYDAAIKQTVTFHSVGRGGNRGGHRFWQCKRAPDEVDCE